MGSGISLKEKKNLEEESGTGEERKSSSLVSQGCYRLPPCVRPRPGLWSPPPGDPGPKALWRPPAGPLGARADRPQARPAGRAASRPPLGAGRFPRALRRSACRSLCEGSELAPGGNTCSSSVSPANSTAAHSSSN